MGAETAVQKGFLTIEQYLKKEDASEVKHEFQDGKLITMAGGLITHNILKSEILQLLTAFFRLNNLPFLALDSDMKTRIESANKFCYPDVTVIALPPDFYTTPAGKERRDIIINPLLVVEVLSNDTRSKDKGEKFEQYCTIPTFREYLLIEPEEVWAKSIYLEDPAAGLMRVKTETNRDASIHLHSIGYDLKLDDVYKALNNLKP
jgi:Uma2 family endonuclease